MILAGAVQADSLTWTAPLTDEGGVALDPTVLYYKLYWGYAQTDYSFSGDHPSDARSIDLDGVPAGCYYLSLTAVRTDTSPELESVQSDSVYYCAGQPTGPPAPTEVTKPNPPEADVTYE